MRPISAARVVGLAHPILRDLDGQFRDEDRAGLGVLHPVEQHAGDPERRGHHARHVAGVQAVGDDVDPQRARHEPAQRRGDPQPVVVDASRVEADDEARRADAVGEGLDVERQVGLNRDSSLDSMSTTQRACGAAAACTASDRGEAGERGVPVVGAAPPVQPVALEHRRPRTEALAPALHLGLLVEVPVEQHGVVVRPGADRRDLHQDHRGAAVEFDDLEREALDRLGAAPAGDQVDRRRPCARWPASRGRTRATRSGSRCSRGGPARCRPTPRSRTSGSTRRGSPCRPP